MEPWYNDAVIYAIDVEKFADSNGDGIGDFPGLIDRLWYLERLGVTCVWLLPFYSSPRRDNGYDVTDHYRIDPRLGTLDDFILFVRLAGERGIRVVVDIVMDHTSDEHPWFKASRRDRNGRFRRYYTWADSPPPIVIGQQTAFPGEESTLWTWDEVAGAYYYHPFYAFQPQLRISEPEVQQELMRMIDYWLSFGVSGFRLDAVPLMLGLDAPVVDAPADPHGILKEVRSTAYRRRADVMLMGEVDQAAGRLVHYFGDGDELNTLINFQLNNYLFLGLAKEERGPVLRGLRQLPNTPAGCTWVNFLRNLDELNIQWLLPEDLQFVWDTFAPDDHMRIYGRGIRRRLAPMIGDPDKLEMAFSLVMALPGSPMFVYGDEIGMGDDLSISGRDAARTPMQWSGKRNAGFSDAQPARLIHPVVSTGDFDYRKGVNVEDELDDPGSLLNAVRRLIRVRRQTVELGRGNWHSVPTESSAVLAYQVLWRNNLVLIVHNMSGTAQREVINLGDHPVDRLQVLDTKGVRCTPVGKSRYQVDLDRYGYGWFKVVGHCRSEEESEFLAGD